MNDPDQARRLTEERIAKLEKDKEQVERIAEESRKNEENAKRLAKEERAKAEESMKNEQIAKRVAEEERRTRLEAQAEILELRTQLGLRGHT
jgi:unconventional prefoldin RPB5 interactor 1